MKLSTLMLSSAAVLVAGSAFAADLPSKKAAPATFVKVCDAFGAGYFTIPGGDNCIKLSGFGRAQVDFKQASGRSNSPTSWTGAYRLNIDVRSNTELGVLRAFGRVQAANGKASANYGYVQLGGFTAGYTDTAFAGYNGDNTVSLGTDDGAVLGALQYTASLGGSSSLTIAVEDASARTITKDPNDVALTGVGASQVPDFVAALSTTQGPATLKLSAATHQNYASSASAGSSQGYAFQAFAKFAVSADTTLYAQGTYEKGALSYLGLTGSNDFNPNDAGEQQSGWNVVAAAAQTIGKGTLNVAGHYAEVTGDYFTVKTMTISGVELNYAYSPVKNFTITPAVVFSQKKDSSTAGETKDSTSGLLRIQRDF